MYLWLMKEFVELKLLSICGDEDERLSSSKRGCINDCDNGLLLALPPPALGRLELDSTLLILPNSLMDALDDRLLVVTPLPLLLSGDAVSATALTVAGGDGDLHFIVARSAAVNECPCHYRFMPWPGAVASTQNNEKGHTYVGIRITFCAKYLLPLHPMPNAW